MGVRQALHELSEMTKNRKSVRLSKVASHLKGPLEPIFIGLLSVPFLFFFTIPGISAVLGIIIAINGARIATQKSIYLPKILGKIKIPSSALSKGISLIRRRLAKSARARKKNPSQMKSPLFLTWVSGWIICFSGALLVLPLPPGTNIPPAVALMLVVIGMYRQSPRWVFAGGLIFILCMGTLVYFLGWSTLRVYEEWPQWSQRF